MHIRSRLGAVMREKNITERELFERSGVARNTIRRLARDANDRVDFETLERLANALGVRPLELLEETDQQRTSMRLRLLPA